VGRRFDPDRAHVKLLKGYNAEKKEHLLNISVVVICHKRTTHLKRTMDALSACDGIEDAKVIFVAHDSPGEVFEIVNAYEFKDKKVLKVEKIIFQSPMHAINHNIHLGMRYAFDENNSDICFVLEDDIVFSPDALTFMKSCLIKFGKEKFFRGVIGYSMNNSEESNSFDVVKINFGVGWGWCTDRRNYKRLLTFWTGTEVNHWDYWIEPYIRTGFIIAPIQSRVMNIGFDSTATHTNLGEKVGKRISQNFQYNKVRVESPVREVRFPYEHSRDDLIVLSNMNIFERFSVYLLRRISFWIYFMAIKGRPRLHFIWRITRNGIDRRFSNARIFNDK
jgi:hypothetical protein